MQGWGLLDKKTEKTTHAHVWKTGGEMSEKFKCSWKIWGKTLKKKARSKNLDVLVSEQKYVVSLFRCVSKDQCARKT